MIDRLTGPGARSSAARGFPDADQQVERTADLRYFGQAYEVRVACPDGAVDRGWADAVTAAFHDAHRALYGYDFRGKPDQHVEWVNLRVTGIGPIPRPEIREIASAGGDVEPVPVGHRRVYYDEWTDAAIHDRPSLLARHRLPGPAVIEEFGSTVPIHPGFAATVDRFANLIIEREDRT